MLVIMAGAGTVLGFDLLVRGEKKKKALSLNLESVVFERLVHVEARGLVLLFVVDVLLLCAVASADFCLTHLLLNSSTPLSYSSSWAFTCHLFHSLPPQKNKKHI